jgi:hypothetical protein
LNRTSVRLASSPSEAPGPSAMPILPPRSRSRFGSPGTVGESSSGVLGSADPDGPEGPGESEAAVTGFLPGSSDPFSTKKAAPPATRTTARAPIPMVSMRRLRCCASVRSAIACQSGCAGGALKVSGAGPVGGNGSAPSGGCACGGPKPCAPAG